ncbi:uncharacterized protein ATC70_008347 [Mucor velutinosus]|uniref:Uncharacterized protein n=1 Tax=Mucor velutinosus TaxID=708070 RepID=A0AAN7DMS2_9FUNG|nr:hypothetical protein ATC70_008347 [Mucor velutinosus]
MEILSLNNTCHKKGANSQSSSISITPSASPSSSSTPTYHKPSVTYYKSQTTATTQLSMETTDNEFINVDLESKGNRSSHDSSAPFSTASMRRLSVPASVYSRVHRSETNQSPTAPSSPLSTSSTAFEVLDRSSRS